MISVVKPVEGPRGPHCPGHSDGSGSEAEKFTEISFVIGVSGFLYYEQTGDFGEQYLVLWVTLGQYKFKFRISSVPLK